MIDSASSPVSERERQGTSTSKRRIRNRLLAGGVLLLAAIIIVPPFININRFRRDIVHSIGEGLGRPVEASAVELQLFPRPGFVLHNLTVMEDPAYGAEPAMTAETVSAGLRASTLWHRRVEIATLRIDSPSVNLTRNSLGRWNFESLLVNSPAVQLRVNGTAGTPMPFPYIEATDARVNFKIGPEKLPFSLEQANLAVWKESSHEWRVRIRARPIRTDMTVADAGEIRGEGSVTMDRALMDAPIHARLEWRRVQLGEIFRLLHGRDEGWRGTVDWTVHAAGTLADMSLTTDMAAEEFRRAEFVPASDMDLSAHCEARYASNNSRLDSLQCKAPLGNGELLLRGRFPGAQPLKADRASTQSGILKRSARKKQRMPTARIPQRVTERNSASLQIALRHVPAGFFLDLLGHIHPGISSGATASGEVNGNTDCTWQGLNTLSACTGEIQSARVRLSLPNLDRPLTFSSLLLASAPPGEQAQPTLTNLSRESVWKLSPTRVSLGGSSPAVLTGTLAADGSMLQLRGAADLVELSKLVHALRIPAISGGIQSIRGSAQLDLAMRTAWLPRPENNPAIGVNSFGETATVFAPAQWTGNIQLRNVAVRLAAFPLDVQLTSAQVELLPAGIQWNSLKGTLDHIPFSGSVRWQVPCSSLTAACARTFALHMPSLNTSRLQATFLHGGNASSLLTIINPWAEGPPNLPEISGTVDADVLTIGRIQVKDAALKLHLQGHKAELMGISGKVFHGSLSGAEPDAASTDAASGSAVQADTGSMQWGDGAPVYTLRATMRDIDPTEVAGIWDEHWGRGTANLKLNLRTRGWSAADLAQNASGRFSLTWFNGELSASPVKSTMTARAEKFQEWEADGAIRDRSLVLESSRLFSQNGAASKRANPKFQSVTGKITFSRVLDLVLHPAGTSITGPLSAPLISGNEEMETINALDQ